jgi:metal-responsive CopG/Arc/MetJ family transcriptional regulator
MATSTTHNIYVPKDLLSPLARYMVDKGQASMSKLVQQALREKLEREGYITAESPPESPV